MRPIDEYALEKCRKTSVPQDAAALVCDMQTRRISGLTAFQISMPWLFRLVVEDGRGIDVQIPDGAKVGGSVGGIGLIRMQGPRGMRCRPLQGSLRHAIANELDMLR